MPCCRCLFVAPGLIWLTLFYAIPLVTQLWVSLQTGNPDDGFTQTWNWGVYPDAISENIDAVRALDAATRATATVLCLIIAFPLAYFMAFKAGRWRNLMLLLIILPFFTSLHRADGRLADDPHRRRLGRRHDARRSACSARTGGCSRRRAR